MKAKRDYPTIFGNLRKAGFFTDHAHADVLHVIKSGANRGLWLSYSQTKNAWLIGTYIQVHYEISQPQDIEQICLECLNAKEPIGVVLPPHAVEKFSLRLLSKEEHQQLADEERQFPFPL